MTDNFSTDPDGCVTLQLGGTSKAERTETGQGHYNTIMTLDIIIQKWAGRNVFYILTQAAGHGGMSRIPGGGGGGREPCVTCIRIELGETICPDGEFSLARPLWCTACTTLTLTLEHYTRVRFNCNFIFQPFTVWRMRTSRRLGKSWKRKYLLALKNSHSRCRLN